jgi:uncharacterized membrane protein
MRQGEAKAVAPAASGAHGSATEGFAPHYAEGYFFGLLCAAAYGVTPILVRASLDGGGAGTALAAGVVSYGAATLALALYLLVRSQWGHALAVNPEAAKWFTYSGLFVCVSQMLVYMAYALAPLTVVVPIQQLSLVFRYIFARMLTPEHEIFGGKVLAGTALSLLGAVAISASTEFVLSLMTLPDALVDIVRWQWP